MLRRFVGLLAVLAAACVSAPVPAPPLDPVPSAPARVTPLFKVGVGDAVSSGPAQALVTIVAFTDFQCPFCARADVTMRLLRDKYGADLRLVTKHQPLSFHADAELAALAFLAAAKQGKADEMAAWMFAHQSTLTEPDLRAAAAELGLDVTRFDDDAGSEALSARVSADLAEARALGIRGTPTFFVNGRLVAGAQPLPVFEKLVDEALAEARAMRSGGVPPDALYETIVAKGATTLLPPAAANRRVLDPGDLTAAPSKGAVDADVTIVEWSDFQCPYCARFAPTLDRLLIEYPDRLRLVFRHRPLDFHPQARPAALASVAAQEQGKFWAFHDAAFRDVRALSDTFHTRWATDAGLDVARFEADRASPGAAAQVDADLAAALAQGVNATPTCFVNGREVKGTVPYDELERLVVAEFPKAAALRATGLTGDALHRALVAKNRAAASGTGATPPP